MPKSRVLHFYQYKKPMDSHCLECDSRCNTILELNDGSEFHCCDICAKKVFKFRKGNSKTPPQSRKAIFKQNSCVKTKLFEVLK
jgi:hypothetical protein